MFDQKLKHVINTGPSFFLFLSAYTESIVCRPLVNRLRERFRMLCSWLSDELVLRRCEVAKRRGKDRGSQIRKEGRE